MLSATGPETRHAPVKRAASVSVGQTGIACRGIYVGSTGDLHVRLVGDNSYVTFSSINAGVFHPLEVDAIGSNTTAGGLVAGF